MDKNFSDAKDIIFARFRLSLTNIELRYLKKISDEVYRQIETESRQAREAVERGGELERVMVLWLEWRLPADFLQIIIVFQQVLQKISYMEKMMAL